MNDDKTKQQLIEELANLRQSLDALVNNLPEGFVIVDSPDAKIRLANRYCQQMLGVSKEELECIRGDEHFRYYQMYHPNGMPAKLEQLPLFRVLTAGEVIRNEEWLFQVRDGRKIPILCHSGPVRDQQGTITGAVISWQDISKRKQAEDALKKAHVELERRMAETRLNEARLEAVLQLSHMSEASLDAIMEFALEQAVALTKSKIGYLAFLNEDETILTMHSWSKEAMIGCAISDKPLVYPLEMTGLWGEAVRQRKPIITNDYLAPNSLKKGLPEGHIELIRHMNVPILDRGNVVIVAGVGNKEEDYDDSDVRQLTLLMEGMWMLLQHQRVQKEIHLHREHLEHLVKERTEALQASETQYRQIFELVTDALFIFDLDGKVVAANPAACIAYGYGSEEMVGLSGLKLFTSDYHHLFAEFRRQIATDGIFYGETIGIRKGGTTFHVEVRGSGFLFRSKPHLLAVMRNIDERKRAEEALRKEHYTLKQLLQSSDHERQTIAYEIHDGLAQYLAGAIMQFDVYKNLLEKKPNDATKVYDIAKSLLRQGHFEARRLIAGVRPPILDESGVIEAVAHLINEQHRETGPKIKFNSEVEFRRLVPILENAIYRICQEGLSNACKHSQTQKVLVSLLQQNDRIRIEVRDWGIGFNPKNVKDNSYGLIGIRERARLLGGKYRLQSAAGKGTRITVELPLMEREELGANTLDE